MTGSVLEVIMLSEYIYIYTHTHKEYLIYITATPLSIDTCPGMFVWGACCRFFVFVLFSKYFFIITYTKLQMYSSYFM